MLSRWLVRHHHHVMVADVPEDQCRCGRCPPPTQQISSIWAIMQMNHHLSQTSCFFSVSCAAVSSPIIFSSIWHSSWCPVFGFSFSSAMFHPVLHVWSYQLKPSYTPEEGFELVYHNPLLLNFNKCFIKTTLLQLTHIRSGCIMHSINWIRLKMNRCYDVIMYINPLSLPLLNKHQQAYTPVASLTLLPFPDWWRNIMDNLFMLQMHNTIQCYFWWV